MSVYIEKNDVYATLTTWIYCAFHMAYNADKKGLHPYINWPEDNGRHLTALRDLNKFSQIPNMYEWYFEQPYGQATSKDAVWIWELPEWGAKVNTNDYSLISEPLNVIKEYYKKHLIFNEETNKRGFELVDKYAIKFNNTIGITWRGTDIYLDGRPRMPIETYFRFIDEIMEQHPDYRIACTAEEVGILDPLLQRYPNAFLIEEFTQAPLGAKDNPEKLHSKISGYERGLVPVLMVWLFSECAYYIKNRSSSGAVASWISNGNIISLGHPENLGYEAPGDYYEVNGVRKQPLYL